MSTKTQMTALCFPGQGVQRVGMGMDLVESESTARVTFEEAGDVLGEDLARIAFHGPAEVLDATRVAQPAVLTASVAAARAAREHGIQASLALGHSLGEYSALVASERLTFADALRLVAARGSITDEVARKVPGRMAAILGAPDEEVSELCRRAGDVWPANFNCPGQVVVSGRTDAVDRVCELARSGGHRVRTLAVSGSFHSPLMSEAAERFSEVLAGIDIAPAGEVAFCSATTAALESDPERIRSLLVAQLTGPVRFSGAVGVALERGVSEFVEHGPSPVLSGLIRRIDPAIPVRHIGAPADLQPRTAAA